MPHARIPERLAKIKPFLAMEVMERALALERTGKKITYMCVGEPDVPTHPAITEACATAIADKRIGYTHSLGIIELREAIAAYYQRRYKVRVSPEQIVVSSGTSPLMMLICAMLVEKGDNVLLTNPCYACYPNFVTFVEGEIKHYPLSPDGTDYSGLAKAVDNRTSAILINSPSNPTGEVIRPKDLQRIAELKTNIIADEIYHGLCYEGQEETMLKYRPDAFIINGFSKAFSMTGWRLGYIIIPPDYIRLMRSMHQNFLICAPTMVQWAGITALDHADEIQQNMRKVFAAKRKKLIDGLNRLGLKYWGHPAGAFYVLVDFRFKKKDSLSMSMELLEKYDVAVTPGIDFGSAAEGFLRLSFATSEENIDTALHKIQKYL